MDDQETKSMFVDPCYAIKISPVHIVERDPMVSEQQWVKSNLELMEKIGNEEWLKQLLGRLKSNEPHLGYVEPTTKA